MQKFKRFFYSEGLVLGVIFVALCAVMLHLVRFDIAFFKNGDYRFPIIDEVSRIIVGAMVFVAGLSVFEKEVGSSKKYFPEFVKSCKEHAYFILLSNVFLIIFSRWPALWPNLPYVHLIAVIVTSFSTFIIILITLHLLCAVYKIKREIK